MEAKKETPKLMTRGQVVFSGIGTGLGLALATYIGFVVAASGKAAIWTVVLGFVLGTGVTIPYRMMAKRAVVFGGYYGVAAAGTGTAVAAMVSYCNCLTLMIYASNPLAISTYVISLLPGLSKYSKWVALAAAVLCFVICIGKVTSMGKLQKIFTIALLVGLVVCIVMGTAYIIRNGTGDGLSIFDLSQDAIWQEKGFRGILSGMPMCMLFMGLYISMLFYGPMAENPKRDIPFSMNWATVATGFFWIALTAVFVGVLPVSQSAGQPLTVIAQKFMPPWMVTLFVICGPLMAIMTTYIGGLPASMEMAAKMAEDGWLPKIFARRNKVGRPWVAALCFTMFPMLLVFLDLPLTTVQSMVNLASAPGNSIICISFLLVAKKAPDFFENRKTVKLFQLGCVVALAINVFNCVLSAYNAGLLYTAIIAVLLVAIIFVCQQMKKSGKITPGESIEHYMTK